MSRGLNSTAVTAISQREVQVFFAIKLEFDSPLRLWSGIGRMILNNEEYIGGGSLLGISKIDETFEVSSRGAQLSLSGIPKTEAEPAKLALNTQYQGKKGTIYLCLINGNSDIDLSASGFDASGLFDPVFVGFMDMMNINEDGATSTINLTLESRLAVLRRAVNRRFTANWLKSTSYINSAGTEVSRGQGATEDKGLDFVNSTPLQKIRWGR